MKLTLTKLALTKRDLTPFLLVLVILHAVAVRAAEPDVEHLSVPGAVVCDVLHRDSVRIPVIILDPATVQVEINPVRKSGPTVALYETLADAHSVVLANGGFFGYGKDGGYVPLGLVRHQGVRLNALIDWKSGGMLAADGKRVTIIPMSQRNSAADYPEALQSKPIIVHDNVVAVRDNPADAPANRVAFGIAYDGRIVIIGAFSERDDAMSQLEFANTVVTIAGRYHLSIVNALSMDGGSSAHLYLPLLKLHFGNSNTYVPNVVNIIN